MLSLAQAEYEAIFDAIIRIIAACIIGGIIGYEREKKNHSAGLRTHLIVCLTSCLVMILSFIWYTESLVDPTRLAQGAITGIGFLGAGTIIRDGNNVRGLTTAASVWMVACLGLLIGSGLYLISIFTTGILIFVLRVMGRLEKKLIKTFQKYHIELEVNEENEILQEIHKLVEDYPIDIESIEMEKENSHIELFIFSYQSKFQPEFIRELSQLKGIKGLKVVKRV
jgi:putative Mg2+ transporter-C (MgtC) family protein